MSSVFHGSVAAPKPIISRNATKRAAANARTAATRRIYKNTLKQSLNNFKRNAISGSEWEHYLQMYASRRKGTFNTGAMGRSVGNQGAVNLQHAVLGSVESVHGAIIDLPGQISIKELLTEKPVNAHIKGKNNPVCLAASNGKVDNFKYLYGVAAFNNLTIEDSACLNEQKDKFNNMKDEYSAEIETFVNHLKKKGATKKVGGGKRSKNIFSSAKGWMKQMSRMFTKKTRKHRQ
jgi:hypothetical protein